MADSVWDKAVQPANRLLMQPIIFQDLQVTCVDFIGARHPADWTTMVHRHPWFEFNYVAQGRVYTSMEHVEFLVNPGQVYLIPPGVMHSHRHCDGAGDDGFCVRWKLEKLSWPETAGLRRIADSLIAGFARYRPRSVDFPADRFLDLIPTLSDCELEVAFLQWLLQIRQAIHPDLPLTNAERREDVQPRHVAHQVLMYLEAYYAADIDVNQLADSLAYSYRHLSRLFKEQTGSTIIEKLNGIRIARAIDLLVNSDRPISLIGSEVGFHTETYFSTIFAEYTELSPSAYRNRFGRGSQPGSPAAAGSKIQLD